MSLAPLLSFVCATMVRSGTTRVFRFGLVLLLVCLIGSFSGVSANARDNDLNLKVVYSESANLTYQLDVVAGVLDQVDPADYQALWQAEFLKTEEDRSLIREWATLKRRYQESLELPGLTMPLQSATPSISLFNAIRVAGLRTNSRDAFLDRASLLMTSADTARLGAILQHFTPAFAA